MKLIFSENESRFYGPSYSIELSNGYRYVIFRPADKWRWQLLDMCDHIYIRGQIESSDLHDALWAVYEDMRAKGVKLARQRIAD